ncbi:MAG: 2-oxoglutarate dehydrogenase complex dihydrolipoyllysine-residue succinyltransferase [Alphaproteobacteria bacterium]|nr:2-oxoglutarate dehydrogenase complex dihydrolipoyllysine-residue succinyltransferase [Alphaproteobacteria bacterium]
MPVEIKVPTLGESVSEATVAKLMKKAGDTVKADDVIMELETDKVTLEVSAPSAGMITELKVSEGATVKAGATLGSIDPSKAGSAPARAETPVSLSSSKTPAAAISAPAAASSASKILSPAAQKIAKENQIDADAVSGTGKGGRATKGDVLKVVESGSGAVAASTVAANESNPRLEERVRMTRLRQRIAERLKASQDTAAILTTFNEVDFSAIKALRDEFKDSFEKRHGVKLGFMSFFVKAAVKALQDIPVVNAQIDGDDIVYKHFCDVGVAVGTPQGLVVPIIRNAEQMSFAQIEKKIADFGARARDGKLTVDDMTGGTFTISNGGVYGSLLSTPIINPPQSAILGMHSIQERPVVVNGQIVIRPMMYLALSYDHRLIDGKEAVTFLVRIKQYVEDPQRLLLDV